MTDYKQNQPESERQWLRACSLVLADKSGQGLELGELRVEFKITKGDIETPNQGTFRVYNLARATASRLQREFTRLIFQAGYQGNVGLLFAGNVIQYRAGVDSGVDRWLEIRAGDGDQAYVYSTVNQSLAAGARPGDQVKSCLDSFGQNGAAAGFVADFTGAPLPRGKVLYGQARNYMRQLARDNGSSWSIQDGRVQVLKKAGYLPGQAVELNFATGLIGSPEQTNEGISVRCLINPRLAIGGRIKLDNAGIVRARRDYYLGALALPSINRDGFYRVLKQEISGDTRGNDWYMDNLCIGIDDTMRLPLDTI